MQPLNLRSLHLKVKMFVGHGHNKVVMLERGCGRNGSIAGTKKSLELEMLRHNGLEHGYQTIPNFVAV